MSPFFWFIVAIIILVIIVIAVAVTSSNNSRSKKNRNSKTQTPSKLAKVSGPGSDLGCQRHQTLQPSQGCQKPKPKAQPMPNSAAVLRPHHNTFSTVGMQNREKPVTTYDDLLQSVQIPSDFKSDMQWPGLVMDPLDQSTCGSCWAFSSSTA